MLKANKGVWTVTKGKGARFYIECSDESVIGHPQQLAKAQGLLLYGYNQLEDLAIAILRFEKEKQDSEKIENNL